MGDQEGFHKGIERKAKEMAKGIRRDIRESKYGLLKIVGLEAIPFAMGAGLGGLGRATGEPWIPAVPIAMDLIGGAPWLSSPRGLWGMVKYGLGVAVCYADQLYPIMQGYLSSLS